MSFERAIAFTLEREGEWSDHPSDRGGRTRWGISSRAHPDVDLATLTRDAAVQIYWERYWLLIRGNELPWPVSVVVFDHAVHAGVPAAVRTLQLLTGAKIDGRSGPATVAAARKMDARKLAAALLRQRTEGLIHQSFNGDQRAFLFGFMNRLILLALECGASAEER